MKKTPRNQNNEKFRKKHKNSFAIFDLDIYLSVLNRRFVGIRVL